MRRRGSMSWDPRVRTAAEVGQLDWPWDHGLDQGHPGCLATMASGSTIPQARIALVLPPPIPWCWPRATSYHSMGPGKTEHSQATLLCR